MFALPASVPLASTSDYYYKPSGPTIYLPPSWSLWPVQVSAVAAPEPFFQHDHTGWQLIPSDQAQKLRLAGENLLDQALAYMTGQIDVSSFTNASNQFFFKVQRLIKTGDDKPRPRNRVNPFKHIDATQPVKGQHDLIEGKRLGEVLYNLLGQAVQPTCQIYRSGEYRYRLHVDPQRGDGIEIERLRPDLANWLKCPTPAYDRLGAEVVLADLKRQYEDILTRTRRPRFAQAVNEHGGHSEVVVERGEIKASQPDLEAQKEQDNARLMDHFWRGFTEKGKEQAAARTDRQPTDKPAPWAASGGLYLKGGDHVQ